MGSSITLLDESVIRKIAAGEVVERPASIVKELVENSLDSSATQITITVEDGGKESLVVEDNGCGIPAADLPKALMCHGTSKIQTFDDLSRISTFGFRGEALASISAVCHFTIKSRQAHSDVGAEITIRSEAELASPLSRPYHGAVGTVVCCEKLFDQVPARKAFLKRSATEYGHILEVIQAFSLSFPHIHWTLKHGSKTTFEHLGEESSQDLLSIWRSHGSALLGIANSKVLLQARSRSAYGSLEALITPPGLDFPNSKRIWTFVNRRWVKDRTLHALVMKGYHTHLLKHRYPAGLVMIHCDPSLVDINIHPAKREVKFQYQKDLAQLIYKTFQDTLRQASWAAPEHSPTPTFSAPPPPASAPTFTPKAPTHAFSSKRSPSPAQVSSYARSSSYTPPSAPSPPVFRAGAEATMGEKVSVSSESLPAVQGYKPPWKKLRYIGSFAKTYLLFEDGERHEMLVVDQHAFHERIIFEQLSSDGKLLAQRQKFLLPQIIKFTPATLGKLSSKQDLLEELGFSVSFAADSVHVHEAPALLAKKPLDDVLESLAEIIPTSTPSSTQAWMMEEVISTLSCHSAIRAGEVLQQPEINRLLAQAESVDFYHNCPHGRRVFYVLKSQEVLRWFDRV